MSPPTFVVGTGRCGSAMLSNTVHQPRSIWRDLPKEEARTLTEACHPGFDLLRTGGEL